MLVHRAVAMPHACARSPRRFGHADNDCAESLRFFGLLEEENLERHPAELPVRVHGFADDEPTDSVRVERDDGCEVHVDILALHMNTAPDALELHDRTHL